MSDSHEDVELPLNGKTVDRCFVDAAFGLQFFAEHKEITIRIGGKFSVRSGSEDLHFAPAERVGLGRALVVVGKVVEAGVARKDGSLELRFTDGDALTVPPDPDYEAWELAGPEGMLVVSTPGGGLAVWKARLR